MSRMSWRAVPGPERLVLLSAPGRDAVPAAAAVLLTAIAKVFNILGLVYVTLPARIAVAGLLALRRRWWQLAAFAAAVVVSEVLIGLLKGIYDRARPPGSLVVTTGTSFPSGHAVAAAVTVVAAVIALAPPGRRRLGAHWLSDAVAGILLGTACAVVTALIVGQIQRLAEGRQKPA